jgi:hypothetical protein
MLSRAATFYTHSRASQDLSKDTLYGILDVLADQILQIDTPRKTLKEGSFLSPLQTLRLFHKREATDPRDKVFGLLALLQDHFLDPDYHLSKGTAYLQTALKIIESTKRLDLLANANSSNLSDLPSWCPDWSIPPKHNESQRLECLGLYNASKGLPQSDFYLHNTPATAVLETRGILLENVHSVMSHVAPDSGFSSLRSQNTRDVWQDGVRRSLGYEGTLQRLDNIDENDSLVQNQGHTLSNQVWKSEGHAEAFWRALCGDLIYTRNERQSISDDTYRRASSVDFEAYEASMAGPKLQHRRTITVKGAKRFKYEQPQSVNWAQNRFLFAMQLMAGGRRMFVTEGRRIGIGPPGILAGDRIALFPGSSVPIALRPQGPKGCGEATVESLIPKKAQTGIGNSIRAWSLKIRTTNRGRPPGEQTCKEIHESYKVVGDVYVSGIMDGEAVSQGVEQMISIFLV